MPCRARRSFQLDRHPLDFPGELERRRVCGVDRRAAVLADVLPFVERVLEPRRALDAAGTDLPAVGKELDRAAFAHSAAVVFEVQREGAPPDRIYALPHDDVIPD